MTNNINKDLDKFSKLKYHYVHHRFRTPLYTYLLWKGVSNHYNDKIKYEYEIENCIYLDKELAIGLSGWNAGKKRIETYLKTNPDLILDIIRITYKIQDELLEQVGELNKGFSIDELEKFFNTTYKFSACMLCSILTEENLEKTVREIVETKFKSANENVFHILTTPEKLSSVKEKDMDILEIANLEDKKEREKRIKEHLENFAWLKNSSYNGEFFTKEDILNEINNIKNPKEELEKAKQEINEQKANFKKYFSKLDKKEQILVKTLGESIHFRTWRTERLYHNAFKLDKVYREIAKTIGLGNYSGIFYLTAPEIISLLKAHEKADDSIIEERRRGYIMVTDKNSTRIYSGNSITQFKERVDVHSYMKDNDKDLADEYLKIIGKRKLWPALNGYSAFLLGSEYNKQEYYQKWYNDKVRFDFFLYMKDEYSQNWLPEDDMHTAQFIAFNEYLKDKKKFQKRIDFLQENTKKLDSLYQEYSYEKINKTPWPKLLRLVKETADLIWDTNGAVIFTVFLDKDLFLKLIDEEKYPIASQKLDAIWEKATEPAFESFDKEQLIQILKLVKEKKPWKQIVEESQYILTDYCSAKPLQKIEHTIKERYGEEIKYSKSASKALGAETDKIAKMIDSHNKWLNSLNKKEKQIAEYLQIVMKIRDKRKNFFAKGLTIMWRTAERMFAEAGVDPSFIIFYTMRELFKGTEYLKSHKEELYARKNGFQWLVPYYGEPKALVTDITPGVEKVNNYFKESHLVGMGSGIIKGQTAFRGLVKGRVHIVLNANLSNDFKDGEILVAGMTRPEYVPLMKKASAIITDEGGITCHAAIVSREMKKPCITGTKVATKVLNDGDFVEVDANTGIVKILKKA